MQRVEDPIETIHLYIVREEEPRPSLLPVVCAVLCLLCVIVAGIVFPYNSALEHETIAVPAQFFTHIFTASESVIPTGIHTYAATQAHGELIIYNGSILQQEIPKGMIFTTNGVEIVVDTSAVVPAGNPPSFGSATVSAHAVIAGTHGNIPADAINEVYGASIYIRNLHPFTGGRDTYTVKVVTPKDTQTAIDTARAFLNAQEARIGAFVAKPCTESFGERKTVVQLVWTCQYVRFTIPSYMHVTHIRLFGNRVFVDVVFVLPPRPFSGK